MPVPFAANANHLPGFITAPGESDWLFTFAAITVVAAVLGAGVFFFWLHSLPERMVHNKVQFDIVAVLALLSLFTHIHAFWVAALLLAFVDFTKFSLPDLSVLGRIAGSLEKMADAAPRGHNADTSAQAKSEPASAVASPARSDGSPSPTKAAAVAAKHAGGSHA